MKPVYAPGRRGQRQKLAFQMDRGHHKSPSSSAEDPQFDILALLDANQLFPSLRPPFADLANPAEIEIPRVPASQQSTSSGTLEAGGNYRQVGCMGQALHILVGLDPLDRIPA